jgi:valyl-tRNA synthetase
MRIGRRLAMKILNASRFVLGLSDDVAASEVTEALDRSMLASLRDVVVQATEAFDRFDYARALELVERSFWGWTDDYLELVKSRGYEGGRGAGSAHAALQVSLGAYLRLFAPFLPFVTEEVWSWWREGSVHRAPWPGPADFAGLEGDSTILTITGAVLSSVRKVKSDARASMAAEVASVSIFADTDSLLRLRQAEPDLKAAARAGEVAYHEGEFAVETVLAPRDR